MNKILKNLIALGVISFPVFSTQAAEIPKDTAVDPLPLVAQRADPSMFKGADGNYYFVATAPEYDRIEMRSAKTLMGIATATPNVIWQKHAKGPMGAHIWAPEIMQIDGVWYIYFTAGDAEDIWRIRVYVLANKSADPTKGTWEELGPVKIANQSFSLDATIFDNKGQRFYLWAQQDMARTYNSAILIAKLENPTTLGAKETIITKPELEWEKLGYFVNEGPAVLKHGNKIFVTYSASATDHRYAMGLLWADVDSDLLDAKSWHKAQQPVFSTNEALKRYGPGHNSFTKTDDGKQDVMVYHARDYFALRGSPLTDANRHTYVRTVSWKPDGFPDFRQDEPDDLKVKK